MKKVVIILSFCLATILGISAFGSCAASGLSLELKYWVPSVDGADEVAWYRIQYEQHYDWSSESSQQWERWTPYTLSPGKAGTYVIKGSLGLTPESGIYLSRWGISASSSVGSPTVPVEYSSESQYDQESQSSFMYADNGLFMWGNTWDLSVDQYYYNGELAYDYEYHLYGDMNLAASSTDLLYERQALATPAYKLGVAAGLKHAAFSRQEATHFEEYYEHYPHSSQGYPEGTYESNWGHEYVDSKASFSLLGPKISISADAVILSNVRLSGRLGYSVLFGRANLSGRYTSEEETRYFGGFPWHDSEDEYTRSTERAIDTSIPILDVEIGLRYPVTDSVDVFASYMASTWSNVPEPPNYDANYEVWDAITRGTVSFKGLTIGATLRF